MPSSPHDTLHGVSSLDRLHDLLRRGHVLTKADAADRLGITTRQVQRLVAQLQEAGVPVEEEKQGRKKAYRLPDGDQEGARLDLRLTENEALALTLAAAALQSGDGAVPMAEALADAMGQITGALAGQVLTFEPNALRRHVHVGRAASVEVRGSLFVTLFKAIQNRRRMQMDYYTATRKSQSRDRAFEPWGLAKRGDGWMCVAYDPNKDAMRDFRLDRMQAVQPADPDSRGGDYRIPDDFDLDAYFRDRFEALDGEEVYTVRVWANAEAAPYFASKQYHRTQVIEETREDESIVVSYEVLGLKEITTFVQSWGPKVKVLAPDALRDAVAAEARAVAAMYAG